MREFPRLRRPVVAAQMAGGPSTPELAAAVSAAGGLGFLAAGAKPAAAVGDEVARVRALGAELFGVNLFRLVERPVDEAAVAAYAASLGAGAGEPRFDDDRWAEKLELVARERVPVVSFTFGCPPREAVEALHDAGSSVWVTVTESDEAEAAAAVGADALVVQGVEAGGHRGGFADEDGAGEIGVLALLRLVARVCPLPLVAAGGIADREAVAAVLAAGATAAQAGTAFLLCPEAGTAPAHREALRRGGRTVLTRAFTGRRARALENRFVREHPDAPSAYPHVHHLTAPLRAAGGEDALSLWAGQAHALAEELPAAEVVARLSPA